MPVALRDPISSSAPPASPAPPRLSRSPRPAAESPTTADIVAPALIFHLPSWQRDASPAALGAEAVLAAAWPRLAPGYVRDFVVEIPFVQGTLGLIAGRDFQPLGRLPPAQRWPAGQALPPLGTMAALQSLLVRLEIPCPISGEWNDATRRALAYFQLSRGGDVTGELNEETQALLQEAWLEESAS